MKSMDNSKKTKGDSCHYFNKEFTLFLATSPDMYDCIKIFCLYSNSNNTSNIDILSKRSIMLKLLSTIANVILHYHKKQKLYDKFADKVASTLAGEHLLAAITET